MSIRTGPRRIFLSTHSAATVLFWSSGRRSRRRPATRSLRRVVPSRIITPLAVIIGLGTIVSARGFSRPRFGQQKENSIHKACSTRECSSIRNADRRANGTKRIIVLFAAVHESAVGSATQYCSGGAVKNQARNGPAGAGSGRALLRGGLNGVIHQLL